jgi:hypothetical protein
VVLLEGHNVMEAGELAKGGPSPMEQDEEQSAQGALDLLPGGDDPAEYREKLKRARALFEFLFLVIAVLDVIFNVIGAPSMSDPTVELSSYLQAGLILLVQGLRGIVAWYFGRQLRLAGAIWLGLAACIPGTFWPTLFTIRGWRPVTFSDQAPASVRQIGGKLEPWVKGWVTAFAVLLVLRSLWIGASYVREFSPLLSYWTWAALLMLYLPGFMGLYRWYWRGRGKNGRHFGLVVGLLGMGYVTGLFVLFVM